MTDYFVSLYESVDVRLDVVEADSPMKAARKVSEARDDPHGTVYEVYPRDFSEPAQAVLLNESAARCLD
jgi:hypothetical protein